MRVSILRRTLRFRAPMETAFGTLESRDVLELTLDYGDGRPGHGEAAPLPPYDGVSIEAAEQALEAYRPVLTRADELGGAQVLDACRAIADIPQALAAV